MEMSILDERTSYDFLTLKTKNLVLTREQEADIRKNLSGLHDRAPAGSNMFIKIELVDGHYKGILRINSYGKSFYSTAVKDQVILLLGKLIMDIDSQLLEWKKQRFLTKTLVPHIHAQSFC